MSATAAGNAALFFDAGGAGPDAVPDSGPSRPFGLHLTSAGLTPAVGNGPVPAPRSVTGRLRCPRVGEGAPACTVLRACRSWAP